MDNLIHDPTLDRINSAIDNLNNDPSRKTLYARHGPPAIKEWGNSTYRYNKNMIFKLLPVIDKANYDLLKSYFNSTPKNFKKKISYKSILKIFISRPEMKDSLNKTALTLYTYNRQKCYFINKIKKVVSLYKNRNRISPVNTIKSYSYRTSSSLKVNNRKKSKFKASAFLFSKRAPIYKKRKYLYKTKQKYLYKTKRKLRFFKWKKIFKKWKKGVYNNIRNAIR